MTVSIDVLIVNDDPHIRDTILREFRRAGFEPDWRQVNAEQAYIEQLDHAGSAIDLILIVGPRVSSEVTTVLHSLRDRGLEIPVIVVTEAIDPDSAVDYMRDGAADYVTLDQMNRLGPIAVRETSRRRPQPSLARERAALGVLAHIVEQSPVAIAITDLQATIEYVNPKFTQLTGYTYTEAIGMSADRLAVGRPDTVLSLYFAPLYVVLTEC